MNNTERRIKLMRVITKRDAFAMRENGMGEFIKKTYSERPKYYLVEDRTALKFYENYRKRLIKN